MKVLLQSGILSADHFEIYDRILINALHRFRSFIIVVSFYVKDTKVRSRSKPIFRSDKRNKLQSKSVRWERLNVRPKGRL
jgi:hypothetical protein